MSKAILNMISFTSLFSQLLLVTLYTLGVLFYKFNKTVLKGLDKEVNPSNAIESVEYFLEEADNSQTKENTDFENFDDYSAFAIEKNMEINDSKSIDKIDENQIEAPEQNHKIDIESSTELIDDFEENYVSTNATITATVEEDFEQSAFSLQQEQENSITMVDEDDIKRVFQSKDWAVRHQQTNH